MIDQPHLYILCGLPFGGKSTLARALADRFGWAHLETDAISTARGVRPDNAPISRHEWTALYREAHRELQALLATRRTVIYDATNFRVVQRTQLRRIAARYDVPTTLIYVTTAEAEARRRWQHNRMQRLRHDVRDEDFADVVEQFQAPTPDEQVIRFDGSHAVASWIDQVFGHGAAPHKVAPSSI